MSGSTYQKNLDKLLISPSESLKSIIIKFIFKSITYPKLIG